jgi:hypothetical protein
MDTAVQEVHCHDVHRFSHGAYGLCGENIRIFISFLRCQYSSKSIQGKQLTVEKLSFITQLTTLTLAPAFYAAAIYFSLARIIVTFGAENSRIQPKFIPRIFISCDVVSLILQGGGGAYAAYLAQREKMPDNGNYTMIGGLSFQALTLLVFLSLSANFGIRTIKAYKRNGMGALNDGLESRRLRQSKRFRAMLVSLTLSAILIFMRSIYRVVELSEGWKGELMGNEGYVIWLEAVPVGISGLILSVFHPATCFPESQSSEPESYEIPDTPPSVSAASHGSVTDAEKYNSKYGNVTVTYDPTFDRKQWR